MDLGKEIIALLALLPPHAQQNGVRRDDMPTPPVQIPVPALVMVDDRRVLPSAERVRVLGAQLLFVAA